MFTAAPLRLAPTGGSLAATNGLAGNGRYSFLHSPYQISAILILLSAFVKRKMQNRYRMPFDAIVKSRALRDDPFA